MYYCLTIVRFIKVTSCERPLKTRVRSFRTWIFGSDWVTGCILKFLPPYSPDFNPIEESFSAGEESREQNNRDLC